MLKVVQEKSSIRWMVAVAAGKGGVGKSSLAVNLALALKRAGHRVGLLDADVYGPSLEQMLPIQIAPRQSETNSERILPGQSDGIAIMTTAHFSGRGDAAIVRAPVANSIIDQFLNQVEWGPLDFLIVDFPPGTGDVQLTLMQKGAFSGALLITTPQEVALIDVRKAAQMFAKMQIPLLGVVENMSYFEDARGERHALFGQGGGFRLAQELGVDLIGMIPLDPQLAEAGDKGESIFETAPDSRTAKAFQEIASAMQKKLSLIPPMEEGVLLADGRLQIGKSTLSASQVQSHCPCARCQGKGKAQADVGIIQMNKMGRYALKVVFTSGCSQGIYPLTLLKELVKK